MEIESLRHANAQLHALLKQTIDRLRDFDAHAEEDLYVHTVYVPGWDVSDGEEFYAVDTEDLAGYLDGLATDLDNAVLRITLGEAWTT